MVNQSNINKSLSIVSISVIVLSYIISSGILLLKPQRAIAATYTVTTNADSGAGSLRQAITDANTNPGADIIVFDNAYTIQPATELPWFTDPVEINGYTGSPGGATPNTAVSPAPFNGTLTIELDGQNAGLAAGLIFDTGSEGSSVRGLVINRFEADGVAILTSNITIAGNYIGTDTTGLIDRGNDWRGIGNSGSGSGDNITIGGLNPEDRNIISGNNEGGASPNTGDDNWTIQGNYIGLGATGVSAIPNAQVAGSGALSLDNSNGHVVGGSTNAAKNVISGNNSHGIAPHNSDNLTIAGNYIGTTYTGATALANGGSGITITDSVNTQIGGTTGVTVGGNCTGECNIISNSGADGVFMGTGMITSTLEGNYIGTDITGAVDMGNTQYGISMNGGASSITIGGSTAEARNVISGNTLGGVLFFQAGTGNTVLGNYIGTDSTGTADLGNNGNGIGLNQTDSTTIGGTSSGARNVISGNNSSGVNVVASDSNTILGNYIGTDATGTIDLGNTIDGVGLNSLSSLNTVGGSSTESRNIISGNGQNGMNFNQSGINNTVSGNYIGTDVNGTTDIGNTNIGIILSQSDSNTIGGTTGVTLGGSCTGSCNLVSGNDAGGIGVFDNSDSNNILGNFAGVNASGIAALGNTGTGIIITTSSESNTVGGTITGTRNIISGNSNSGVVVIDSGTNNTTIQGNYVGTDTTGMNDVGNLTFGIDSGQGASNTLIGGTTASARNIIAGNNNINLSLGGNSSTAQGNFIGLNADGSAVIYSTAQQLVSITGNNTTLGGTTEGAGNFVAGGGGTGVLLVGMSPFGGSSTNNAIVQGNCIGTNVNCEYQAGFGNTNNGLAVMADAYTTQIGGVDPGAGNVIAGNGAGIAIGGLASFHPEGNSVLLNSIYNNSGAASPAGVAGGIDLFQTNDFVSFINIGVTPNDANDIDYGGTNDGPNHYLNFPVLNSITSTNGTVTINYNLDINDSEAFATGYRVDFYANDNGDVSGHGQGKTHLGYDTVAGDVTDRQVTITLPAGVEGTKYVTAITTMTADITPSGFAHSSEFAANIEGTLMPATTNPAATALAATGRNIKWISMVAAILLASGGAGLYVARRKKRV